MVELENEITLCNFHSHFYYFSSLTLLTWGGGDFFLSHAAIHRQGNHLNNRVFCARATFIITPPDQPKKSTTKRAVKRALDWTNCEAVNWHCPLLCLFMFHLYHHHYHRRSVGTDNKQSDDIIWLMLANMAREAYTADKVLADGGQNSPSRVVS